MTGHTPGAGASPLIVLVDDVRIFRDGRPAHVAQTAQAAISLLSDLAGQRIDELWLDYDLFDATSEPLVEHLVTLAEAGAPADIGAIRVHSARTFEAVQVTRQLRQAGYAARLDHTAGIWARNPNTIPPRPSDQG